MARAAPAQGHPQAPPSILSFIALDVASFVAFFAFFMFDRLQQPELFARSATMLDVDLGLLNTIILITSGWLVALAVAAARDGNMAKAAAQLVWATVIGLGFALTKVVEYGNKIDHGVTPYSNLFFEYYYLLTGIHFFHYVIGVVLLGIVIVKTKRRTVADAPYLNWLESTAVYWHMVDLLWIFLFPILYLQGL